MDKEIGAYLHSEFSHKEHIYVIHRKMDATGKTHIKETKSGPERQISYICIHLWFLEYAHSHMAWHEVEVYQWIKGEGQEERGK